MKFSFVKRLFLVFASCTFMSGCALHNPSFNKMAAEYQSTVEQYSLNNILLNIVRASSGLPLSFLDIPSIIGSGSFSASVGGSWSNPTLAGPLFNPASSLSVSPSATVGKSFNFTQSSLDNSIFQTSFNTKIPLSTLNFFSDGNISTDLLINLMIESITFVTAEGKVETYINSPYAPSFDRFQSFIQLLIKYNLTTQINRFELPVGPKLSPNSAAAIMPVYLPLKTPNKLNMKFFPAQGKEEAYYQIMQINEVLTICIGESEYLKDIINVFQPSYFCSKSLASNIEKSMNLGIGSESPTIQGKASISYIMRSNRDIYRYLGELLKIQTDSPDLWKKVAPEVPLFVVRKNENLTVPLANVTYRGNTYDVPSTNNGFTPEVFNILSQLLNLNKVVGSIPTSPSVIVK